MSSGEEDEEMDTPLRKISDMQKDDSIWEMVRDKLVKNGKSAKSSSEDKCKVTRIFEAEFGALEGEGIEDVQQRVKNM
ncbi:hypothetical protein HNY73_002991 [Argiope bruennichi]|uniref:Uncharacterized protein n=1 Tax=Argiope bruennichi TaxID=94029 RepID=A0A8T0G1N8_ARGBR|nr:hypothetical protein HNY73_002991 [Argiope bruennichi]